jgi:arylsulfatase A-like enzyme
MHLFGQATLAARRLVEAGSRFVTVFWDDFVKLQSAWDTHYNHFPKMRNLLCPGLDQTLAALIEDLEARGLLDETAIACISEHGRTPNLDNVKGGGRGHWSGTYSAIFAGGGFARGKVVGKSDRSGGEVADNPVSPKDVLATLYHLMGIDPHQTIPDRLGRPIPVAGEGVVRPELLA